MYMYLTYERSVFGARTSVGSLSARKDDTVSVLELNFAVCILVHDPLVDDTVDHFEFRVRTTILKQNISSITS